MVKIKVKKEVTIVDLFALHYAREIKSKIYTSNNGGRVIFKLNDLYDIENGSYEDMFEVEVEEEIDENTAIPRLLEVRNAVPSNKTEWKDLKILKSYLYGNHSISEIKNEYSVAIYMLNDDYTMTLIWKNGEMVK